MNIIVHYPQSAEAIAEFKKRVATVHIEAIATHINSLSCPKAQKLELLENIKTSTKLELAQHVDNSIFNNFFEKKSQNS